MLSLVELVEKVNEQGKIRQGECEYRDLRPFTVDDARRLIKEGRIRDAEYYPNGDAGEVLREWNRWIRENEKKRRGVLPRRFKNWLDARFRRGERRHEELATSPRYHNAIVKLRLRYNIPPSGFSADTECEAWTHWFNQEVDKEVQERKRRDRCMFHRLQQDCEKLANKFRTVGDWTIVYRHMLYDKAIRDFVFGEGWRFDFDADGRAHFNAGNATQESERHGKRFFKANFGSQYRRPQEERDKEWYDAITRSGKLESEAIREIADVLAKQEGGYSGDPKYEWRVKRAYQREKRRIGK